MTNEQREQSDMEEAAMLARYEQAAREDDNQYHCCDGHCRAVCARYEVA